MRRSTVFWIRDPHWSPLVYCADVGKPRLHIRSSAPSFLDLPWEVSIAEWQGAPLVEMPTGIHRHPVVFVSYPEGVYAIKELPVRHAKQEYDALYRLEERSARSARAIGLVERRWLDDQAEASAAVITRYVNHAFPYRELVDGLGFGRRRGQVRDALSVLLVELHLAGCFWGDCSLSNALYRYDAGAIEAVMIDGETSSLYESLSDGQRAHELEIMIENLAGDMSDLSASYGSDLDEADLTFGEDVAERYEGLWAELSRDLVIGSGESYRIRERIVRLNELGFSVDDVDLEPTEGGDLVTMKAKVGGRVFHSQRLRELTGIDASENQARRILSDINYHLGRDGEKSSTLKSVRVMKWRLGVFEPMMAQISDVFGGDPIQGFCDFLNFRIELAQARGGDVPNQEALAAWTVAGLPGYPVGRTEESV